MAIDPDLFAAVVEALEAAGQEFDSLADPSCEWPIPDDLQALLDQREALLATLSRVCQGFEKTGRPNIAKSIRSVYAEELPKAEGHYELTAAPGALADVTDKVTDALERVRRAALVDGDVRDALDTRVASV